MGLYGGLHLPLKKWVLPTGGAWAPSLASSAATTPCFSVKIKHESLVRIFKHSPLAAGSSAPSELRGTRWPRLIFVAQLNSFFQDELM